MAFYARGCKEWLDDGLQEPECVTTATEAFKVSQDHLGHFLDEHTITGTGVHGSKCGLVYERYKLWAGNTGEQPLTFNKFSGRLKERGWKRSEKRPYVYEGLGLRDESE